MQTLSASQTILVWSIAGGTIAGVMFRPKEWPEAVWACLGAALLILCGLVPARTAIGAVGKGTDVYLFLAGMMLLAELARVEGVFDWLAALAVRASRHSRGRLFTLVYGVGIPVTVFLSNDATAVVLTPAVCAAVRKARADALTTFSSAHSSRTRPASSFRSRIRPILWFTEKDSRLSFRGCEHFLLHRSAPSWRPI
jgi:Na+/H+ antiporter NhaD/arsenite permease-like protein